MQLTKKEGKLNLTHLIEGQLILTYSVAIIIMMGPLHPLAYSGVPQLRKNLYLIEIHLIQT